MSVTFDVSKWLTSRLVRLLQLLNIKYMFVTFDVSKWLTSRLARLLQP